MTKAVLEASEELERFWNRRADVFADRMLDLVRSKFGKGDYSAAFYDLLEVVKDTLILANLHGRKRILMEADNLRKSARFDEGTPLKSDRITFEEAVADLVQREPRLESSSVELSRLYNTEKVFGMVKSIDENLTKRVQQEISQIVLKEGRGSADLHRVMQEITPFTQGYSQVVYRTNLSTSYNAGRFQQARDPDVAEVVPAMEYIAQMDARTRPNHAAHHGMIAATNDPIWHYHAPPQGYQCFPAATQVSARAIGASKVWYSGELVEIELDSGISLSVTINHPILSDGGWVKADELSEGEYLLCHQGEAKSFTSRSWNRGFSSISVGRRTINDQQIPTVIEDVFESIRTKGMGSSHAPVLPLNFNGDAKWMNGDIHIVRTYGEFWNDTFHESGQFVSNLSLPYSDFSDHSSVDGLGDLNSLIHSFASPLRGFPSRGALALDNQAIIGSALSKSPLQPLCFGLASELNAQSDEFARYSGSGDAEFVRQLQDRDTGQVTLSKIVRIGRYPFSGHVYDLETEGGWIIANGIYTSNCRCSVNFVSVYELERRGLVAKNGGVGRYLPPGFGQAAPDKNFKVGVPAWSAA